MPPEIRGAHSGASLSIAWRGIAPETRPHDNHTTANIGKPPGSVNDPPSGEFCRGQNRIGGCPFIAKQWVGDKEG